MKVLISSDGKKFLFKDQDIHTSNGYIKSKDIIKAKPGSMVKTHLGKVFSVVEGTFYDLFSRIKRGAQTVPLKDIGSIVAEIGLGPKWNIVDAGSGSGAMACFLAHLVPKGKVFTYDVRDDHLETVNYNIRFLGLKNVYAKRLDVYADIPNKNMDFVFLDLPEPWKALDNAVKSLKFGGFIASYSPCVPQASDFVEKAKENSRLVHLKTFEIVQREWEFDKRKIRPKSQPIGHSGFITVIRKI